MPGPKRQPHGTLVAYRRHIREKEEPCEACQRAYDESQERGELDPEPRQAKGPGGLEGALRAEILFIATMWNGLDPVCGGALVQQAPAIARELSKVAAEDPDVAKWLEGLSDIGKWGGVAVALMPVGQVVAVHHIFPMVSRRRARRAEMVDYADAEIEFEPEEGEEGYEESVVPNGQVINPREFAG